MFFTLGFTSEADTADTKGVTRGRKKRVGINNSKKKTRSESVLLTVSVSSELRRRGGAEGGMERATPDGKAERQTRGRRREKERCLHKKTS